MREKLNNSALASGSNNKMNLIYQLE